ncbi:UNVERIFIED_CONTAM: MFS family permease [Brevibacillus sp. OAP136]
MGKKQFGFLVAGQSLANIGDVFYIVSMITLVYTITGTAVYTAMFPALRCLAQFTSGILAPLLLDRFRLRSIIIASQLGQTILLLGLTVYSAQIDAHSPLYGLYGFIILMALLDGWTTPTRNAMIPLLVEKDQLMRANGLMSTVDQSVQMAGWAMGGVLVAWLGGTTVLWLTFAMFSLSALSLFFIRLPKSERSQEKNRPGIRDSLKEGWSYIWTMKPIRILTTMDFLEGIAGGVWMAAILLVYVNEVLHQGEQWWGFINASYFLGTIAGGVIVIALANQLNRRLLVTVIGGTLCTGLLTLCFIYVSVPVWALVISALFGPVYQLQAIAKQTLYQRVVPTNLLPKVLSAQAALAYITFGFSAIGLSYVSDHFGIRATYDVAAALIFTGAALGWFCRSAIRIITQVES